jgi:ABC-type Fe3+ transport system permease subunit
VDEKREETVSFILDIVLLFVTGILHPHQAAPNDNAAAFAEYAADTRWLGTHLMQLLGTLLLTVVVILPLVLPGVVAGSIFTFSLTLGDFIVPYVLGNSTLFIGQAVLAHQGTAENIPLAAAFTVVPMVIMAGYLMAARRAGAFDAL